MIDIEVWLAYSDETVSEGELDRIEAKILGVQKPESPWILTDRDVWHSNPAYRGPEMPHPEDEAGWMLVEAGEWEEYLRKEKETRRMWEEERKKERESINWDDIPF